MILSVGGPSPAAEAAAAAAAAASSSSSEATRTKSSFRQQQPSRPTHHLDDIEEEHHQEEHSYIMAHSAHHHHGNNNHSGATSIKATTTSTTTTGRKGDPRMHRAVAARLNDPSLTLFQALVMGGFDYTVDDYTDSTCMDSDHVTLAQRKNQLSRRLRLAKRHGGATTTTVPSSAAQSKATAAIAGARPFSSSSGGVAAGMNKMATNSSAALLGTTSSLDASSIIMAQQQPHSQNQGLAEMLRQQRESFRLLQQQQLQQGANAITTTAAVSSTNTLVPGISNNAAVASTSWSWDNELQDPSKESSNSPLSPGTPPPPLTATAPPLSLTNNNNRILQAKDHPDFHPIIVSRVGGNGSACINNNNIEHTKSDNSTRRHSYAIGTTTTANKTATAMVVPGTSINSSNSSPLVPSFGNMFSQQQSLNRSTSLSTTMAAAAASTEQALAAQAQQEQQQAFTTMVNVGVSSNATKMHPSGLALHSISKTAQSLGMTLELFALALASADTQRLSEALFPQTQTPLAAPADVAASQQDDAAMASASEESPAKSQRLQQEQASHDKNDGNNNTSDRTSMTTSTIQQDDTPLTRQEELALQLHMHEAKTLYSKCMLLAGYTSEQAAPDNRMAVRFSLEAWEREGQRLQQSLKTRQDEQHEQDQQHQHAQPHQQDSQHANNNDSSTNQNGQQTQHQTRIIGSSSSPSNKTTSSESIISSSKRKRVNSKDYNSIAATAGTAAGWTKVNSNDIAGKHQEAEGHCTFCPGLHIHRLEGKCGHKAIVHNPKDGPAHIDFIVGTKVECYHQLRPLQATTIMNDDTLCDQVGACTNDASSTDGHGESPPTPTPTQNTTIWPSQFKCQDLSCSIACNKLKPMVMDEQSGLVPAHGFGNSLDGTVADDMIVSDQPEQQSTAAVAATLANNYFNMNPRIFDLNELDLESGEWNWDLNDVGFLGLFKLGDTAPASSSTAATTTTSDPPPPAPSPATPTTSQHANAGTCGSGKRVKQLEILHEHLQQEQEAEAESSPRKKKKKQK